jgi:ribonucleoside-diphosphate reductase alpha chain
MSLGCLLASSSWEVAVETTAPKVPDEAVYEALELRKFEGIEVRRFFTKKGVNPFESINWVKRDAVIIGADGKEKFRQNQVEVPDFWPENTVNIVAEKYFRVIHGKKENSAKQMFWRVANWITVQGKKQKMFRTEDDAEAFCSELLYILIHGMYAFNSPVWFNAGAVVDPQCSACFIQSVEDSMSSIMDLAKQEVMLFKSGSGTGGNLSTIRSSWEELSRGGWASGPVSFMKGFDAFAGVTKSGGTTRRAAKMQVLNIDHPDIMEQRNGEPGFIQCKAVAEKFAHDLYETGKYSAEWNKPGNVYDLAGYQNANNSVRVTDEFMQKVKDDGIWETKYVASKETHRHYSARKVWEEIAKAAWYCGDPGIQFDTATNEWHTCKESGRINASNPCSEYLFLDETACNLGSLNLLKFLEPGNNKALDISAFRHAIDITITAKEVIVGAASYPTHKIAENSRKYRTLGLGFTNLGALLTLWGLPYDSEEARNVAAAISSIMGGEAYLQSAVIAEANGPFPEYRRNKKSMLEVIEKHRKAAHSLLDIEDKSSILNLILAGVACWDQALEKGKVSGYRNAQTTNIAPTGTISFLMVADTTAIEPMLGVVVYKKIVGGGLMKMPNNIISPSLKNLGYSDSAIEKILEHIKENEVIHGAPEFDTEKHGAVFSGALGSKSISPEAHIDMMAAVQPFISGGISKTVNMPSDATVEDIANIYMRAWEKGLKCVAVFRDGCKLSQPINTKLDMKEGAEEEPTKFLWGQRRKLPDTRLGKHHKFRVAGVKGYLQPGEFPDGKLGETFIRISKQGSFLNGMVESFATVVSIALQYGAPLEVLVEKFKDTRFEPSGFTGNPDIQIAKSLVDYIFRWLENEYLTKKTDEQTTSPSGNGASGPPILVIDATKSSYDGPPCRDCGSLTKRAGACYVCDACGTSTGCG